jgi:hypothetical protein
METDAVTVQGDITIELIAERSWKGVEVERFAD